MQKSNNEGNGRQAGCAARWLKRAAIVGVVGGATIASAQSVAFARAAPQSAIADYSLLWGGDARTDMTVWRPSDGTWYVLDSYSGGGFSQQWGARGDIPVAANYNYASADGNRSDFTVFRNGTWYWIDSGTWNGYGLGWGVQGDIPVAGDFDGCGKSEVAIWRPFTDGGYSAGTWWVLDLDTWTYSTTQWGAPGDIPVPCDYDGDGRDDYAVFRPSNGTWYFINSSDGGQWSIGWGQQGDRPVPGYYSNDARCDFGIYRPSTGTWWIVDTSAWTYWTRVWGVAGDVPVQGDYDGDGATDTVIWRPSDGYWWGIRSSDGSYWATQWGTGGPNGGGIDSDVPLPNYPGSKEWVADVLRPQQQSMWCWAATTEMVAEYYNVPIDQCQEANVNTGRNDCCTDPVAASGACNQGGWWTLTSHGFSETDLWGSAISFAQLEAEINANRPVPFAWAWSGTGGHAMVATKTWVTSSGTQWVSINDPWPPNVGAQTDMLYTYWVSSSGHHSHWRDSYNVIRQY